MAGRWWSAIVPFAATLLASTVASAQGAAAGAEPPQYYQRIEQAVHEYDDAHWPEAYALFQQAHALSPNARTLRGLGLTAYKLRRYAESVRHLEAALASSVKPMTAPQRVEVRQLLEWARRYVGRIELKLTPDNAQALIDGAQAAGASVALDIGEYALTVRAPGYVTHRQRLVVEGARQSEVRISLVPLDVAPKRTGIDTTAADAPHSGSLFASPWLWTAVGVVAAGAVLFAVTREGDVTRQPPYTGGAAVLTGPTQ